MEKNIRKNFRAVIDANAMKKRKERGGREGKIRGIEINKNRESNFSSEFI